MVDDSNMEIDQTKIDDKKSKDVKMSNSDKDNDTKERSTKTDTDNKKESSKSSKTDSKQAKKKDSTDKDKDSEKNSEEGESKSTSSKEKKEESKSTVDREKVCPFLLRVFCKRGNHHRIEDFTINRQPVEDEVQVYTWKDASLRELASLLAEVDPKYAKHGTTLSFKAVYLDSIRARYNSKDLGVINVSKPSKTDDVTLDDNRFIIGDFIDVAIQSYSDVRRRYSYDRQDSFGSRLGSSISRYGSSLRNVGLSYDRKRKGKIGDRHDRFSRTMRDDRRDDRRGSFRSIRN